MITVDGRSEYLEARRRIAIAIICVTVPGTVVVATLIALVLGLSAAQLARSLVVILPPLVVVGVGLVVVIAWAIARGALAVRPTDTGGARLRRILEVPRRVELLAYLPGWIGGGVSYAGFTRAVFGGPSEAVAIGLVSGISAALFLGPAVSSLVEDALRPAAVAAFRRAPAERDQAHGLFWTRQRWYLPYAFTVALLSLLFFDGMIVFVEVRHAFAELRASLEASGAAAANDVAQQASALAGDILPPVALVTAILVGTFAVTGRLIARRLAQASSAVEVALRSVADRKPEMPAWIASDETGDLAHTAGLVVDEMARALRSVDETGRTIQDMVVTLKSTAAQLSTATAQQAASVTETAHTMAEMAQTSAVSATRALELIKQGESASSVVEEGARAAGETARAMTAISGALRKVAEAVGTMTEKARRIDSITETVTMLADQSSTLAVNAAIEAVKAGEAGKGFGVVAREIRALASDSRKAAGQIRDLVQEIRDTTRAVDGSIGEGGQKVEAGGSLVERLRAVVNELGGTMREAVGLMRQVASSAKQHEEGVTQMSEALMSLQQAAESIREGAALLGETATRAHATATSVQRVPEQQAA